MQFFSHIAAAKIVYFDIEKNRFVCYNELVKREGCTMKTFEYVITNPVGIHARPAGNLVKFAKTFESEISITNHRNSKTGDAKKLFSLLSIAAMSQDTVTVTVEGPDEDTAFDALQEHFAVEL